VALLVARAERMGLSVFDPVLLVRRGDVKFDGRVGHRSPHLLFLLRVDPPQRWRLAVISQPREVAFRMTELVPVGEALEGLFPRQDVVMLVREDAVDLADEGRAFLRVELLVVEVENLVDALVLDPGDVVRVFLIRQLRADLRFGVRKGQPRPT